MSSQGKSGWNGQEYQVQGSGTNSSVSVCVLCIAVIISEVIRSLRRLYIMFRAIIGAAETTVPTLRTPTTTQTVSHTAEVGASKMALSLAL